MQRDLTAMIDGAIGGGGGTIAMSAVMVTAQRAGLLGRHPPEHISAAMLDAAGVHGEGKGTRNALAVALHFGFGVTIGALFGLLHRRLRLPLVPGLHGAIFGSLVWAVSYKGWIPALGIMPPPERDRPNRPMVMLVAHWVYGATLEIIVDRRARQQTGAPADQAPHARQNQHRARHNLTLVRAESSGQTP